MPGTYLGAPVNRETGRVATLSLCKLCAAIATLDGADPVDGHPADCVVGGAVGVVVGLGAG
jgi:hypothetical protein